jgi:hypothetical protein
VSAHNFGAVLSCKNSNEGKYDIVKWLVNNRYNSASMGAVTVKQYECSKCPSVLYLPFSHPEKSCNICRFTCDMVLLLLLVTSKSMPKGFMGFRPFE